MLLVTPFNYTKIKIKAWENQCLVNNNQKEADGMLTGRADLQARSGA